MRARSRALDGFCEQPSYLPYTIFGNITFRLAGQGGRKRNRGYEISFCMDVWKETKTNSPKYIGRWKRDFYRE
jgi:hypothetical protein